jgi:hypothetical protein
VTPFSAVLFENTPRHSEVSRDACGVYGIPAVSRDRVAWQEDVAPARVFRNRITVKSLRCWRPLDRIPGILNKEKRAVHLGVVGFFVARSDHQVLELVVLMVLPKVDALQTYFSRSILAARRMETFQTPSQAVGARD